MRTEPGGVWLLNEATDELTHVETHRGSTIASSWPAGDAESLYAIQRGCDWLLNAAGAGFEAYRRALRARWPGDARGLPTDSKPWQFWHRTFYGLSGGATRRLFMGDLERATRQAGFVIDDSKDGDVTTGWPGGQTATTTASLARGSGPGGALAASLSGAAGSGGGAGVAGSDGPGNNPNTRAKGGPAVSAFYAMHAVITNNYAQDRFIPSGGGSAATSGGELGGASGNGLLRVGVNNLTESTNRDLSGVDASTPSPTSDPGGGGGGGGVYLAIVGGDYTLSSGTTINCDGGSGGNSSVTGRDGSDGGNGHIIIMANGDITLDGTTSNAVVTQWRIITAAPPGGSLISS